MSIDVNLVFSKDLNAAILGASGVMELDGPCPGLTGRDDYQTVNYTLSRLRASERRRGSGQRRLLIWNLSTGQERFPGYFAFVGHGTVSQMRRIYGQD
jgi:hypothetical protein